MSQQADTPTLIDAEEALESGDIETALVIAEGLLDGDPDNPEVLFVAADCLLDLQEPGEALHLLDRAIKQAPDEGVLVHSRGIALFEQCRFDQAEAEFKKAMALETGLGEPRFYLGILAERRGETEVAAGHFQDAVDREPESLVLPRAWTAGEIRKGFDEIVEEMPDPFGLYLASLSLQIEDLPTDKDLAASTDPISPLVHCIFDGKGPGEVSGDDPDEWLIERPELVRMFRLNLGKSAQDEFELHREMLEAVLWEVMDFLGLEDRHLARLGILEDEDDEVLHPVGEA